MFSHMDPSKEGSSAITTEAVIQSQTKNEINVNVRWDPKYVRTYPGILKTFALVRLSKLKSAYMYLSVHLFVCLVVGYLMVCNISHFSIHPVPKN